MTEAADEINAIEGAVEAALMMFADECFAVMPFSKSSQPEYNAGVHTIFVSVVGV